MLADGKWERGGVTLAELIFNRALSVETVEELVAGTSTGVLVSGDCSAV